MGSLDFQVDNTESLTITTMSEKRAGQLLKLLKEDDGAEEIRVGTAKKEIDAIQRKRQRDRELMKLRHDNIELYRKRRDAELQLGRSRDTQAVSLRANKNWLDEANTWLTGVVVETGKSLFNLADQAFRRGGRGTTAGDDSADDRKYRLTNVSDISIGVTRRGETWRERSIYPPSSVIDRYHTKRGRGGATNPTLALPTGSMPRSVAAFLFAVLLILLMLLVLPLLAARAAAAVSACAKWVMSPAARAKAAMKRATEEAKKAMKKAAIEVLNELKEHGDGGYSSDHKSGGCRFDERHSKAKELVEFVQTKSKEKLRIPRLLWRTDEESEDHLYEMIHRLQEALRQMDKQADKKWKIDSTEEDFPGSRVLFGVYVHIKDGEVELTELDTKVRPATSAKISFLAHLDREFGKVEDLGKTQEIKGSHWFSRSRLIEKNETDQISDERDVPRHSLAWALNELIFQPQNKAARNRHKAAEKKTDDKKADDKDDEEKKTGDEKKDKTENGSEASIAADDHSADAGSGSMNEAGGNADDGNADRAGDRSEEDKKGEAGKAQKVKLSSQEAAVKNALLGQAKDKHLFVNTLKRKSVVSLIKVLVQAFQEAADKSKSGRNPNEHAGHNSKRDGEGVAEGGVIDGHIHGAQSAVVSAVKKMQMLVSNHDDHLSKVDKLPFNEARDLRDRLCPAVLSVTGYLDEIMLTLVENEATSKIGFLTNNYVVECWHVARHIFS